MFRGCFMEFSSNRAIANHYCRKNESKYHIILIGIQMGKFLIKFCKCMNFFVIKKNYGF